MRIAFIAVVLSSVVAVPLMAQSNDAALWYVRSWTGKTSEPEGVVRAKSAPGWAVSANRYWTKKFSTEFTFSRTGSEARVDLPEGDRLNLGKLRIHAATLMLQLHAKQRVVTPYIGAGIARISAGTLHSADLQAGAVTGVEIKSTWNWGLNAGLDFNMMPNVAFVLDGKYLRYNPDSSASGDVEPVRLKLNPMVLSAGLRYRF